MDRLEAMRAFQRVVETGSFSGVARERGVAQPTISKQISALETHLGAQLLNRTSRSLSLDRSRPGILRSYIQANRRSRCRRVAHRFGARPRRRGYCVSPCQRRSAACTSFRCCPRS